MAGSAATAAGAWKGPFLLLVCAEPACAHPQIACCYIHGAGAPLLLETCKSLPSSARCDVPGCSVKGVGNQKCGQCKREQLNPFAVKMEASTLAADLGRMQNQRAIVLRCKGCGAACFGTRDELLLTVNDDHRPCFPLCKTPVLINTMPFQHCVEKCASSPGALLVRVSKAALAPMSALLPARGQDRHMRSPSAVTPEPRRNKYADKRWADEPTPESEPDACMRPAAYSVDASTPRLDALHLSPRSFVLPRIPSPRSYRSPGSSPDEPFRSLFDAIKPIGRDRGSVGGAGGPGSFAGGAAKIGAGVRLSPVPVAPAIHVHSPQHSPASRLLSKPQPSPPPPAPVLMSPTGVPQTYEERLKYLQMHSKVLDSVTESSKLLGSGGFGQVYLGVWLRNPVAIKTFDLSKLDAEVLTGPRATQRMREEDSNLMHEAIMLLKLQNPYSLNCYGVAYIGEAQALGLIMEPLQGSLYNFLRKEENRPLPVKLQKQLMTQTIAAVAYLHNKANVHQDLKTQNYLIDVRGDELLKLRMCDYGLTTEEGTVSGSQGTYHYMAPEVFLLGSKSAPCHRSSDIFSLGCVLYEIVTGHFAMDGLYFLESTYGDGQQVDITPPLRGAQQEPWEDIIYSCLKFDPKQRPNIDKLADMLDALCRVHQ